MALSFGCTEDILDTDDQVIAFEDSFTMHLGFLNEHYIENDKMIIELGYVKGDNEALAGNLRLHTEDDTLFDSLKPFQLYMVAYDENYNVISIEKTAQVADLVLDGQVIDEPTITEEIQASSSLDTSGFTLLDSYSIDIYGDEEDEKISMYTDAEKDPEGNIMWDDGQNWTIVVQGKEGSFVLFDDYLQLASLEYFVYTVEDDFYIATVNSGTANLTMTEYLYIEESDIFEKTIKSDTSGNVNMIYKSLSGF